MRETKVPTEAFLLAREAHLRDIGREDLLPLPPKRTEPDSPDGLRSTEWLDWLAAHPDYNPQEAAA